jgi:parallel beta-helix repeat protein
MKMAALVLVVALALAGCTGAMPTHPPSAASGAGAIPSELPCIPSGGQDAINSRLQREGDVAVLCPGAVFELTSPVVVGAARQSIYTQGFPRDDTRATLRIVAPDVMTAVLMRDHDGAVLSNVIIDGGRTRLGPTPGWALIYAGGASDGQIIRDNKIMNTRSWTSLLLVEGPPDGQPCQNALVEGNEIGPAGTSDTDDWADGISLACTRSTVRGNVITDATNGGIVVFGALGSLIENNTVRAETQTLLGGIRMVDFISYEGDYSGTIVRNNVIDASGAVIRIGVGMGSRVWVCLPPDVVEATLTGGTVTGNILRGDKMQYGFAVDGVRDWTVTGNIDEARHSGTPSVDCNGQIASAPAGFLYNPLHAQGVFQPEFTQGPLDLALWAIVVPEPGQ